MSYLTVAEIESGARALARAYPDRCRLVEMPNPSAEEGPVAALELGAANQPAVIIVGGLHAREWIPPDALLYLVAGSPATEACGPPSAPSPTSNPVDRGAHL